jgi:peptidoglycan/xylan/chitin deacetylase (PgdA/CDA1 family)
VASWVRRAGRWVATPFLLLAVVVPAAWFAGVGSGTDASGAQVQQPAPPAEPDDSLQDAIASLPARFGAVPVLNYHDVSNRDSPYALRPERFAGHMAALRQAGVTPLDVEDLEGFLAGSVALPDRPALITFDDGAASSWIRADPVLEREGLRATMFLITSKIGTSPNSYYLNEDTVTAMVESGRWTFGAHTDDEHRLIPAGETEKPSLLNRRVAPDGSTESQSAWLARVQRDLDLNLDRVTALVGSRPRAFAYPFSATEFPTNDITLAGRLDTELRERFQITFTASDNRAEAITATHVGTMLPRLSVLADLSPSGLVRAITAMVPPELPTDLVTARWTAEGSGTCGAEGSRMVVEAAGYTACRIGGRKVAPAATLYATVAGVSRKASAVVGLDGPRRVEVAIGESRVVLRLKTAEGWQTLAVAPFATNPFTPVPVTLDVRADTVAAHLPGLLLEGRVPGVRHYTGPVLAVAGEGGRVTFDAPRVVQHLSADGGLPPEIFQYLSNRQDQS